MSAALKTALSTALLAASMHIAPHFKSTAPHHQPEPCIPLTLNERIAAHTYVAHFFQIDPHQVPLMAVKQSNTLLAALNVHDALAFYAAGFAVMPGCFRQEDMSILVHEPTHHFQFILGEKLPCHNAAERQAYTLEDAYAAGHGGKRVSRHFINMLAACPANQKTRTVL